MAKLKIEHLDDDLLRDLEWRASLHGYSVEEELNSVLRRALGKEIPEESPELTPVHRSQKSKVKSQEFLRSSF